ncbi:MAG: S9 family peptidase [Acidobacteria bacterium]|nr:S9 family peptidase [Acidobacteriota bacterium]
MRRAFIISTTAATLAFAAPTPRVPTIDDLLAVRTAGGPEISPDGRWVAYTVTEADFKQDGYVSQIWLADAEGGRTFQLTRGEKTSSNPQWSPDGAWLAFTSNRAGGKNQVFAIRPEGGEALQLTDAENGAGAYSWSEDGKTIAFLAEEEIPQIKKDRKEFLGDFTVVRRDYSHSHIWTVEVAAALEKPQKGKQRTQGADFHVGSFSWSPDSAKIAFSATINPDLIQGHTGDIYLLDLADDAVTRIVGQPGPDGNPQWSPDGTMIAFTSYMGDPDYYARNSRLAVVSLSGGTARSVTDSFDENPGLVAWTRDGIYFSGSQKTASHLFRADPATGSIRRISAPDDLMAQSFSLSRDGGRVACLISSPAKMAEVCVSGTAGFSPRELTRMTDQTQPFILGSREVISWKSTDGTVIEGVLIKPADFDPGRKYPLLCIIHGGPTAIDRPVMLQPDMRYYPSDIWAGRGALILKVNYRGSAGYGEKFRRLNHRNLGVGDAWDVISGVDYLVGKGWVDPAKVGCMGWSQGGYISAFLTTSSNRFAAISVGAGISNWATYYYNTDITPFTINYLGDDPVDDPEIYEKTSPMSYIKNARTPTLIQHGEFDRRVPIPNAYELRQGLEDRGVKAEMIVYAGYGHGITKPKSVRAVMMHNLAWFNHYIFGDPLPDFTRPEVPEKEKKKEATEPKD